MMKNNLCFKIMLVGGFLCGAALVFVGFSFAESSGMEKTVKWEEKRAQWEQKQQELMGQLGLSPEQESKLKENKEKHFTEQKDLREKISTKRDEIKQELEKADFDINKVKQVHEELKVLKAQMEDHRLNGILEVRSILTPEQFEKFMSFRKGHRSEWRQGKNERMKDQLPDESNQ